MGKSPGLGKNSPLVGGELKEPYRESWFRVFLRPRLLVAWAMGFASGLPLLLVGSLFQAWLSSEGVGLASIGLVSLFGLPYTLKFLWSPFFDTYAPLKMGRRKGWLALSQLGLFVTIGLLGLCTYIKSYFWASLVAFIVAFFSASQDIVVDAYRRETLPDNELGLGSAYYIQGYRVGMLIAGSLGLILADYIEFPFVYLTMAFIFVPLIFLTLLVPEPHTKDIPSGLKDAVKEPLRDMLMRKNILFFFAFLVLYKVGDNVAGNLTTPFLLGVGYSKTQIGIVAKFMGFWAIIFGTFLGGVILLRVRLSSCLIIFGILQGISTGLFSFLAKGSKDIVPLFFVMGFENLTGGMGTAALTALIASRTNVSFTATQYALLTSLVGIPRVVIPAPAGVLANLVGWEWFFFLCAIMAIPGLLLIKRL